MNESRGSRSSGRSRVGGWGLAAILATLLLLVFGLVVCCFAAARDGLDKTIQHTIDGSCAPGVFPLVSVPTVVGCAGALLIVVAAIATPIARTQKMRELWFYGMSGGAVLKIAPWRSRGSCSETARRILGLSKRSVKTF